MQAFEIFRNFWGQVGSLEQNLRRDLGHGHCGGFPIPLKDHMQV